MVRVAQRFAPGLARPVWLLVLGTLWGSAFVACTKARPLTGDGGRCVTWQDDLAPLVARDCQSCHAGEKAAGQYDLSSYLGALGPGSDATANVIAGDAQSRLLTAIDPAAADATHAPFSGWYPTASRWVVSCEASLLTSSIHRPGILDPTSADFHGKLVRDEKYDFGVCQKCHGEDFAGGTSKVSCLSCHKEGPTTCATCHAKIAQKGSHAAHLGGGPLAKTYACAECHKVPTDYKDPGHIFLADGSLDPAPAEVSLTGLAAVTPSGATRTGAPAFDADKKSCTNVYCHGALLGDSAATNNAPVWTAVGQDQAACGTCHGTPPHLPGPNGATAPTTNDAAAKSTCIACHPTVVSREGKVIAPALHIDGQVQFADATKGCAGCHGATKDGAPPPDLTGATVASSKGVGAHQAHLTARAHLRGPIACNECHNVPTEVGSAGHFAGHAAGADPVAGAEVFPARAAGTTAAPLLAAADNASPKWSDATATCSGVYCHGGGAKLAADPTTTLERAPLWTASTGLTCGIACHGAPPKLEPHLPTMVITDCATCHPRTVDPTGQIIVAGPIGAESSTHMNGVVDVAP